MEWNEYWMDGRICRANQKVLSMEKLIHKLERTLTHHHGHKSQKEKAKQLDSFGIFSLYMVGGEKFGMECLCGVGEWREKATANSRAKWNVIGGGW